MLGGGLNSLIPNQNPAQNNSNPVSQPQNEPLNSSQSEEEFFFKNNSPLNRQPDLNNPNPTSPEPVSPQPTPTPTPTPEPTPTPIQPEAPIYNPTPPPAETFQPQPAPQPQPEIQQPQPTEEIKEPVVATPASTPTLPVEVEEVDQETAPDNFDSEPKPKQHVFHLEVSKIKPNPYQPRRHFDEDALRDLASSIREFGVLQPLVVTKVMNDTPSGTDVSYELIAGERRLMASKKAGLERVPAIIRKATPNKEKLELAIIENLQRENLNPIESARAFAKLQDQYGMTQREIGARLGKSREVVANSVRLLSLPSYIQEAVETGKVGESQARLLISIASLDTQQKLFEDLIKNNLSVRELRSRVISTNARTNAVNKFSQVEPEIRHLQEKLSELFGTKVKIDKNGDTGKITITFTSPEELKGIIDKVSGPEEDY